MKSKTFSYNGNLEYDSTSKEWLNYENGGMGGGGCRTISTLELLEEIDDTIRGLRKLQFELLVEKSRVDELDEPSTVC